MDFARDATATFFAKNKQGLAIIGANTPFDWMACSELKCQPPDQPLGELTQYAGRTTAIQPGAFALLGDPLREALNVMGFEKGNHQLVVQKQAAFIEIGRTG